MNESTVPFDGAFSVSLAPDSQAEFRIVRDKMSYTSQGSSVVVKSSLEGFLDLDPARVNYAFVFEPSSNVPVIITVNGKDAGYSIENPASVQGDFTSYQSSNAEEFESEARRVRDAVANEKMKRSGPVTFSFSWIYLAVAAATLLFFVYIAYGFVSRASSRQSAMQQQQQPILVVPAATVAPQQTQLVPTMQVQQ